MGQFGAIILVLIFLFDVKQLVADNGRFHYGDDTWYPYEGSMEAHYRRHPLEVGPHFTFIQAAVTAIESFCKSRTGKELKLSMNHALYLNLRRNLKKLHTEGKSGELGNLTISSPFSTSLITDSEANTFDYFWERKILLEKDFDSKRPIPNRLWDSMPKLIDSSIDNYLQQNPNRSRDSLKNNSRHYDEFISVMASKLPEKMCTTLDCLAVESVRMGGTERAHFESLKYVEGWSQEPAYTECIKHRFEYKARKFEADRRITAERLVVDALSRNYPVFCTERSTGRTINITNYIFDRSTQKVSFQSIDPGRPLASRRIAELDCEMVYWLRDLK